MLRQRVVTAIIALIIVIATIIWGAIPWRVLVSLGTLVGIIEFSGIAGFGYKNGFTWWAVLCGGLLIWMPESTLTVLVQAIVGVTVLIPVVSRNQLNITGSGTGLAGILYLAFGGRSLGLIRTFPHGIALVLLFLVAIWMTDTSAYFVGWALQGPKLWPEISPKKTISGAFGGVVGAVTGSLVMGIIAFPRAEWLAVSLLGLLVSVAGQCGDLIESAYKRSAGVKDSGRLMPGHGGILDRVDSVLYAAPLAYFLIAHGFMTWLRF